VYCVTFVGPFRESRNGRLQGASTPEWPSPFAEGASPQMGGSAAPPGIGSVACGRRERGLIGEGIAAEGSGDIGAPGGRRAFFARGA
jgi:hypothetical protein